MQDFKNEEDEGGAAGGALYQETVQLGFQSNAYAPGGNADIMFAYGPDDDQGAELEDRAAGGLVFTNQGTHGLDWNEVNYHTFQQDQKLAFTGTHAMQEPESENLGFQHEKGATGGFGLPNYFGDLPGSIAQRQQPDPIEISNAKRGRPKKAGTVNLGNHLGARNRPSSAGAKGTVKGLRSAQKRVEPAISREKAVSGWNDSTVPQAKYFDPAQDKDYMRKKRANGLGGGGGIGILSNNRSQSALMGHNKKVRFQNLDLKGQGVATAGADVGRDDADGTGTNLDVQFLTKGGRQTQYIQIYKDIDELGKQATSGKGLPADYSMKQNRFLQPSKPKSRSRSGSRKRSKDARSDGDPVQGHGEIDIADAQEDSTKSRSRQVPLKIPTAELTDAVAQALADDPAAGAKGKYLLHQSLADAKMSALMGKTLEQKEKIIRALEAELEIERKRRKDMGTDYHRRVKDFETEKKAISILKAKADKLERIKGEREREALREEELDWVPTKDKGPSKKGKVPAKHQLQDHPIFFKNSRIESQIPKFNNTSASSSKRKYQQSARKTGQSSSEQVPVTSSLSSSSKKNLAQPSGSSSTPRADNQQAALQQEFDVTHQVLAKLRDNPNKHLGELSSQVAGLNAQLEPLLKRVEQAQYNVEMARATHGGPADSAGTLRGLLSQQEGKVGMMARMGGKLMNFYADDLTEMLLDDLLYDAVVDLQDIEAKERKKQAATESAHFAEELLKHVVDFQGEQHAVELRWGNEAMQARAKNAQAKIDIAAEGMLGAEAAQALSMQPKPLRMGPQDGSLAEVSISQSASQSKQAYVNPFDLATAQSNLSIAAQHVLDRQKDQAVIDSQNKGTPALRMDITDADKTALENYQPKPRKYKLGGLTPAQLQKITKYKERYGQYLQLHNNSKQKEVWKIYDHITDQLMAECVDEVLQSVVTKDIEGYLLEQVLIDEFQL